MINAGTSVPQLIDSPALSAPLAVPNVLEQQPRRDCLSIIFARTINRFSFVLQSTKIPRKFLEKNSRENCFERRFASRFRKDLGIIIGRREGVKIKVKVRNVLSCEFDDLAQSEFISLYFGVFYFICVILDFYGSIWSKYNKSFRIRFDHSSDNYLEHESRCNKISWKI